MPIYDYKCLDCEAKSQHLIDDENYLAHVLFETKHGMTPSEEELRIATQCPRCNSNNCVQSFERTHVVGYIRGNGILDINGAKRDMNVYKLTQDDPYAPYRQPGEVEDMKLKLQRAGKHNPKTKYFVGKKTNNSDDASMREAVKKSVFNN